MLAPLLYVSLQHLLSPSGYYPPHFSKVLGQYTCLKRGLEVQVVQYGNALMTFFISVSGSELLLLQRELRVSKLKRRVNIPEHSLSTR